MANWMTPNERDLYRIYQAWRNSPSQPISQVIQQLGSSLSPENFSHGMRRLAARAQSIPGWSQHSVRMVQASRMARAGKTLSTVSSFSLRAVAVNGVRAAATFLGAPGIITLGSLLLIGAVGLSIYWYNQGRFSTPADGIVDTGARDAGENNRQGEHGRGVDFSNGLRSSSGGSPGGSSGGSSRSAGSQPRLISLPRGIGEIENLPRRKAGSAVTVAVGHDGIARRKAWEQQILNRMSARDFGGTWSGSMACPKLEIKQSGRTFRGHIWVTVDLTETHYITRKVPVNGRVVFRGREPVEATLDLGFARGSLRISGKSSLAQGEIDGQWVVFGSDAAKKERQDLERRYPFRG